MRYSIKFIKTLNRMEWNGRYCLMGTELQFEQLELSKK